MGEQPTDGMSEPRAILTDREREIIKGIDVSDDYRYQTISRIRRRFDRLEEDLEVLDENHDSLGEELRDVICEDD
ncbi:hypothetical protein [Saliphagus infecundisoli]|uniref:Uncharacterized protein n=1 Tax=Saliphagus infecundisoli TaxID=1849069 RepID=A0ABD5QL49_9EURY|nr:hypothetical protein [Saliphagus infecundisoli]